MIREQDLHSLINFTLNTILSNPFNQDLNKIPKCFSYLVSCKLSYKPWINSESWWYSYFPKPKWISFSWKQKFAPKHGWKKLFWFSPVLSLSWPWELLWFPSQFCYESESILWYINAMPGSFGLWLSFGYFALFPTFSFFIAAHCVRICAPFLRHCPAFE